MINSLPLEVLVQVLDALPVRIFWKDRESRFLGCNRRFCDDAGVTDPKEFIGKSDYFFYHPDQARAFRDDDAEVMFSGKPKLAIEEKLTRANGDIIWLETTKLPLGDADGCVIGVLGMYHEITARKLAEDERCRICAKKNVTA
jgi:PAS domain S-box-containing protein